VPEFQAIAPQAIASDGLAQGPYVAARAEFEPVTFGRTASNLPMSHHTPLLVMLQQRDDEVVL